MGAWDRLSTAESISYPGIHASDTGRGERLQIRHGRTVSAVRKTTAERCSVFR